MRHELLKTTAIRPIHHSDPQGGQRPSKYRQLAQYTKTFLPAIASFAVAAALLGQIIPSPAIPSNVFFISPKYDYYQAHKHEYDTLFFGSSRVHNQIIPEVFDSTSRQAGIAVNSYNFGVPAMRAIDSTVLIKEVLKDPPKNLKWVFFETTLDKGYEPIFNARTYRSMYWHTWENTGFAARYILSSEVSAASKAALLVSHCLPALYRQMNVGRLFSQTLSSEFSAEEQAEAAVFTRNEGYAPLIDENSPYRQDFLQHQDEYKAAVAELTAIASTPMPNTAIAENKRMLLAEVTRVIRTAGAKPIFIEPPSLEPEQDFRAAWQQGEIETLLAYKDPERFPQLYRVDQRFDAGHLNGEAAQVFSQLLAQDFVKTLTLSQSNP